MISAALRAVPNLPEPAASPPDAGQDAGFDAGFDVGLDASLDASPAAPSQPASTPAPNRSLTRTLEPRPVLAVAAPSTDADELAELADAVEALAGAEVEVALAELSELDAVAAARDDVPADVPVTVSAEPAVWTAPVDGEGASELLALTLPFSDEPAPSGARVDDASHDEAVHADDLPYDEDAPLTPEGHAQAW